MRLLCHSVMRNEANRYLKPWLAWHLDIFDDIHVYDDASTDETPDTCERYCKVTRGSEPMFVGHEGRCRQTAWRAMEEKLQPTLSDWIFCIDADEILGAPAEEANVLWDACYFASQNRIGALIIPIHEVFGIAEDGTPLVRVDGYWGRIAGTRLFRYQPRGTFADKPMGCGSEPGYVQTVPRSNVGGGLHLLHYGYAMEADRQAKYARYSSLQHGHSNDHIESILKPPTLEAWKGSWIEVGARKDTTDDNQ